MSIETPTGTDWLTVPEAAASVRTGRRSIYRAINRGDLRATGINNRGDLRIARSWLVDWLERCARKPEPKRA